MSMTKSEQQDTSAAALTRQELLNQAFKIIYNLNDDKLIRIMEAINEKTV